MTAPEVTDNLATSEAAPKEKKKRASALAMFSNTKSIIGLSIIGVFVLIAIFQSWLAPYGPLEKDYTALRQAPSSAHWLGTTHMGEDVFSQLIYGTRGVLIVGFTAGIFATIIAVIVGVSAGYFSGWKSETLSAITNVVLIVPAMPLIIIVASRYENPNLFLIAGVLAITSWAWGARILRSQTMSLKNRDFVRAAKANGESIRRLISVEMLPNLMAVIASSLVGTVTASVLSLTSLAFIGIIPISNLNWGTILYWAQQNGAFPDFWWWYVPAGVLIAILGAALSLVNFGIDEYVNPRLRSAGELKRSQKKKARAEKRSRRRSTPQG